LAWKEKEMEKYSKILVEKKPPIGKVIYNDPATMNALSTEMMDEATDAFLKLEKDDEVRVILLTHTGDRIGGALGVSGDNYQEQMEYFTRTREYQDFLLRDISKPIITYGSGISGGDIIIASDRTRFSMPAIRFGMPWGSIATAEVSGSPKRNRRYLLTGDFFSAEEARDWGIVDEVVPPEKLEEKAAEMATKLVGYDPEALKITKQSLWRVKGMSAEQAQLYIADLLARYAASEHGQKQIKEFRKRVEKRTGLDYSTGEARSIQ
jgi:enoyl-CoA hydratase/carnithine racemase